MRKFVRQSVVAAVAALAFHAPALALETDQYTPPPAPLPDISPQVQQKVRATLQAVVSRTNADYLDHSRSARTAWFGPSRQGHANKAAYLQTEDAVAGRLYEALGPGVLQSPMEAWIRGNRFPQGRHQFAPSIGESIYGANPLRKPPTLLELSPTVNLFGVYLGTDKVSHFFAQGWEYYAAYRKAELAGEGTGACLRKAIGLGVFQEENYFGLLTVGVFSNADLASNYAGLKFYLNLTRPVLVDGRRLPPILVKKQDLWQINPDLPEDFLRPFVTEHWNEAKNPNLYTGVLLETVRSRFPERSADWARFYRTDLRQELGRARQLETFFGEPYGHSGIDRVMTVADLVPAAGTQVQHATVVEED